MNEWSVYNQRLTLFTNDGVVCILCLSCPPLLRNVVIDDNPLRGCGQHVVWFSGPAVVS